ncbi:shikimate dehydrogenase [Salinimonas sp. HHU 13199]|uniref:Shikimate dehydrogenase (NADP(+)) n=1 Tax=Salinimonas profundi TaxID=2729140 RepID=A0ABR8LHX6_9ALTE|nr:shikimate dehydrogenase [Salinimonas profundi]MBD3585843.1 shikimate dehydrogenase [Salinimonas profundi]
MNKFAVFGNPIAHSLSPTIHQMFAEQHNLSISYEKIGPDDNDFENAFATFFNDADAVGCNVTAPFKGRALQQADTLNKAAELAGAVNTLYKKDSQLQGFNTDGIGLVADIQNQGVELADKKVLIIGAGGAARGAIHPLLEAGVETLAITNRTMARASQICDEVNVSHCIALDKPGLMSFDADIIINSTSASLHNQLPDLQHISFIHCELAYDMAYSKDPTLFMQHAKKQGATQSADGLGMLVEQAAAAFTIWTGKLPQTRPVIESLRKR